MMLLRNFNRQATVIRLEQFGMPKVAPYSKLELPRGSILHYIPTSGISEIGPAQTLPMLDNSEKLVQVNHVTQLSEDNLMGRPKRIEKPINREIMQYHRINKKLRRMHSETMVERDDKTLLVENYAPIRTLYRYPQTLMAWYERFHNLLSTMVGQLGRDADKFERQNYLLLTIPDTLPAKAKLRRAEKRRDNITLDSLRDENSLFFLELWTWLGESRSSSLFASLTETQLRRINVILQFNGKFVNLNLGELNFWRRGDSMGGKVTPDQMQKRLYKTVISLAQAALDTPVESSVEVEVSETDLSGAEVMELVDRSDADEEAGDLDIEDEIAKFDSEETISEDEDFEIIKQDVQNGKETTIQDAITIDTGVEKACEKFIDAGTLSTKEYQRILDKASSYKTIDNPFGEGTLADMLEVKPEEVAIQEEVLIDDPTILDKSMAKTTTRQFNRKYINNVLPKDIVSNVVSIQRAGVVVEDYRVEKVIDAANRLQIHTLKLTPVKGRTSTIRFTTPLLDEDGYWTANDIRYGMRKQRVDLPIRKTAPDTVALTTFYGKNFVRRSQSQSANWSGWLSDQIVANGLSVDNPTLRDLKFSNVFDPTEKLPRDYTIIAKRLSGFTAGSVVYNFDVSKVNEFFDKEEVKELHKQSLTPVGKSKGATYGMDAYSIIYKKTASGIEEVGRMTEVLGIDTDKAPKEFTELSMMGKSIPLAIIFAYYLGIENMLREFNVSYRTADASERVPKDEGDMVITMKDSKLVLTFDNNEQELIFQGFKSYLKLMRDYTLHDYNQKDVYLNLIQKDGLSIRYLNELDLMDAMFVDPVSERLLKKMKEPTHFKGLLKRANELVTLDNHKPETDMNEMHIFGYQRIAGAVYTGLVRGVRDHNNRPGSNKKIDIPSSEIWSSIAQDPSVMPASDANPMQSVKEADVVTFGGNGGRSRRSMVKHTRQFLESDLGVISGDTVDSGDVGITSYMSANPIFEDIDGAVRDIPRDKLDVSQYISSAVALAPGSLYDDDKRANFVGIQHGSGMAADGYEVPSFRTGYEKLVAHRTGSTQAVVADYDGKVLSIDEYGITVEYDGKPKVVKSYPIGKTFGKHEGAVFPHELVANVKKGQKFSKGAVLTYNKKFFEPDIFNPTQVNWKLGVYANVVLLEGVDTLEDSSAISPWLSEKLRAQTTKVKNIAIRFDQAVHNLVNVGDDLNPDDHLCLIEDGLTAGNQGFSSDSIETLKRLASQAPQAKVQGRVDRVEVFYNGDFEDMSESVLEIVKKSDRRRKKEAKASPIELAETGRVDSTLRIDGNPVELDTMIIRVYLTQDVAAVGGDKAVFANQMKTTFRRVMVGRNETASGLPLHAVFGKKSIDDRIVLSVYQIGTTVMICDLMQKKCQEILKAA